MDVLETIEGYDVDSYFALVECGVIAPDDRIELLEGLIVSMAPPSPMHCAVVYHVQEMLHRRLGPETLVRGQMTFLAGPRCVPEPDVAVVPGRNTDYLRRHPSKAALVIEVADSSLVQERVTKAAIYARAGVPTYWIVNLRDSAVECLSDPDSHAGRYRQSVRAKGTERLPLTAFPHAVIHAADLFPVA
jgi:Uma2 family endonuclease